MITSLLIEKPTLTLEEIEKKYIALVLQNNNGNMTRASKVLGIDRRTLYRKVEKYKLLTIQKPLIYEDQIQAGNL